VKRNEGDGTEKGRKEDREGKGRTNGRMRREGRDRN
jgi:hypothetical protein